MSVIVDERLSALKLTEHPVELSTHSIGIRSAILIVYAQKETYLWFPFAKLPCFAGLPAAVRSAAHPVWHQHPTASAQGCQKLLWHLQQSGVLQCQLLKELLSYCRHGSKQLLYSPAQKVSLQSCCLQQRLRNEDSRTVCLHVDRVLLHEICWPVHDHDMAQQSHNYLYLYVCCRGLRSFNAWEQWHVWTRVTWYKTARHTYP